MQIGDWASKLNNSNHSHELEVLLLHAKPKRQEFESNVGADTVLGLFNTYQNLALKLDTFQDFLFA